MTNIWAYNPGSESAKLLAEAMDINIIRHRNSKYVWRANKVVINWGGSGPDLERKVATWINDPRNTPTAQDKIAAFRAMQNARVSIPGWTTDYNVALQMVRDGTKVVARATTTGMEGRGITIVTEERNLPRVPLYTQYIPKKFEYRIHVVDGQMIDAQRKVRAAGHENKDFHVRNTANGFVFQRQGVTIPERVREAAIAAVAAVGLDFGGVDVIYNERRDSAYVLEINTAPGIMGTTVQNYKVALERLAIKKLAQRR